MSRRVVVLVCLLLGLAFASGVASADPSWEVPDGWGDKVWGDVCKHRGDPPCHTTTTAPTTPSTGGTSTGVTTTTDVAGTSATSVTTTDVAGTTSAVVTTTSQAGATTSAVGAGVRGTASPAPRVVKASTNHALADTGASPLWTAVGGLVVLLGGAVLLLFSRRRRA
ncbi:LPXTG cell wall anchor domain-containing protein [Actinosynnema sp. NPDC049800]